MPLAPRSLFLRQVPHEIAVVVKTRSAVDRLRRVAEARNQFPSRSGQDLGRLFCVELLQAAGLSADNQDDNQSGDDGGQARHRDA